MNENFLNEPTWTWQIGWPTAQYLPHGAQLRSLKLRDPHRHYVVGRDGVESITVSVEHGTPWAVVRYEIAEGDAAPKRPTVMHPLAGDVDVQPLEVRDASATD